MTQLAEQRDGGPLARKVGPAAKMPAAGVLDGLSATDRRLVRRRLTERMECMFDPSFSDPAQVEALLSWRGSAVARTSTSAAASDDSGLDLLSVEAKAAPAADDETQKFLWLNYCRYRVMRVIQDHAGERLSGEAVAELLKWEHAAAAAREEIVRANVPLVLAMAKRARMSRADFADLVSEGNLALVRATEKFDCRRGYKFSTYACRAILKSFSRVALRAARYRGHFPTEFDPTLEKGDAAAKKRATGDVESLEELRAVLTKNLAELTDVEEQVIRARFALDCASQNGTPLHGKTLEQVGEMIGVTKERVRQIQNKALGKLRHFLENDAPAP